MQCDAFSVFNSQFSIPQRCGSQHWRKRDRLLVLSLLGPIAAGLGCREPEPVIDRLPPPYTQRWQARPMPFEQPEPPTSPPTKPVTSATVVVDPGHGGKDPGADGLSAVPEKTIVLAIAQEVARGLTGRGAKVVTTRSRDVFIELDDRADLAERARADLVVSIHADANENKPGASGATFYIAREATARSVQAALRLDAAFRRAGIETRGVQRANYRVLVGHTRPAVLIECGFMTNSRDVRLLNSPTHRSKVAAAIVDGVTDYLTR